MFRLLILAFTLVILTGDVIIASSFTSVEPQPLVSREPRAAILIPRTPQELTGLLPVAEQRNNEICGIRRNAVPDIFTRVVGGSPAEKNEFPWQVSLQFVSNWYTHHICGGTVIDQNWILTAAHCTHNFKTYQLIVVASEHRLTRRSGEEQTRKVDKIVEHPLYKANTQENDISLIKLSRPLILDGVTVSPICLPPYLHSFRGNCVVTGWGNTKEDGESSNILRKVVVPIITDTECRNDYLAIGYTGPIKNNMICAGYSSGGKDACQGDSGGPFICRGSDNRYYLTGVVSWGIGCAKPNVPGVYTEVSHFVPWITNVINEREPSVFRPITTRLASQNDTNQLGETAAEDTRTMMEDHQQETEVEEGFVTIEPMSTSQQQYIRMGPGR